jgi:hypothetical protein
MHGVRRSFEDGTQQSSANCRATGIRDGKTGANSAIVFRGMPADASPASPLRS